MGEGPGYDLTSGDVQAVAREVDELRRRAQALIEELERRVQGSVDQARATVQRVKSAVNLPQAAERHKGALAGVGAGTALLAITALWARARRRRRAAEPLERWRRHLAGWRQLVVEPERALRKREPILRKLLAAVLTTGAATLVRTIVQRLAEPLARPSLPRAQPSTVEVV